MKRINNDSYEVGQIVQAAFTNSNRLLIFVGKIVGRTKNYWKVESLESVYPGEQAGRVFHVFALGSRQYSSNNSIQGLI